MFYKKVLKITKFLLLIVLVILACVSLTYFFVIDKQLDNKFVYYVENDLNGSAPLIKITDNYGRSGFESFDEFIKQEKSISNLYNLYNEFIDSEILDYYEISMQPVEFIGEYNHPDYFLKNEYSIKNELIETQDGKTYYTTPLKSIQIGKETYKKLQIDKFIINESGLVEKDFENTNEIPVILGYDYKEYYNLGDALDVKYLTRDTKFIVKGFFNQEASLIFDNSIISLDNMILAPLINCDKEDLNNIKNDFFGILYSVKTSCFVSFDSIQSYANCTKEIEKLARDNDLSYTFVLNDILLLLMTNDMLQNHINIYSVFAFIIFNIILFILLYYIKMEFKRNINQLQSESVSKKRFLKFKCISKIAIVFAISLVLSYFISLSYFRYTMYLIIFFKYILYINFFIIIYVILILITFFANLKGYETKVLQIK